MKNLVPLLVAGLVSLPVYAEAPAAGPLAQKRAELFQQIKAAESDSHQARVRILQDAEACIQAAGTPQEYRVCEQREQAARQAHRAAHEPQRQALRDEIQRLRQSAMQQRQERMRPSQGPARD